MKATEIPRIAIQESWTVYEPIRDKPFDDCRERLGYDAEATRVAKKNSAALSAIVKQAGVEPLSLRAVDKYKSAQQNRANLMWPRLFLHCLVGVGFNYGIFALFVKSFTDFLAHNDAVEIALACLIVIVANAWIVGAAAGAAIWGPGGDWEWKSTPLKGYSKPVPEFALAYALSIQRVNPDTTFAVEELIQKERVADPFLTVSFGGRMYYIAVWDEPKFEGRKTK